MTWRNLVENAIVVTVIENHDLGNIGPEYSLYIFKNRGFWVLIKKALIVFIVECSMGFEGSPSLFFFEERGRGEDFSAQALISLFVILWNIFGRHYFHMNIWYFHVVTSHTRVKWVTPSCERSACGNIKYSFYSWYCIYFTLEFNKY